MFAKYTLSLNEVQKIISAVLDAAKMHPESPICVAVADDGGDLLGFLRMEGTNSWHVRRAQNKAYSAAILRMNSGLYGEICKQRQTAPADAGDPRLAAIAGGIVVRVDGQVVAGIGVSGDNITPERDEELAYIGLNALGFVGERN